MGATNYVSTDGITWQTFQLAHTITDCAFSPSSAFLICSRPYYESNPLLPATNELTPLSINMLPAVQILGKPGSHYRIQYADDLSQTNWTTAADIYVQTNPATWIDPQPHPQRRMYRAVRFD